LPDTPVNGIGGDHEVLLADAVLLGVYGLAGIDPVAYRFENDGKLQRNVVANPKEVDSLSSHGSRRTFPWHTDNPAQRFEFEPGASPPTPKYLGFTGLRNADAHGIPVTTDVLDLATILAVIPAEVAEALRRPEFFVKPPASNRTDFALEWVPLLVHDSATGDHLRFEHDICTGLTPRAYEALEAFNEALDAMPYEAVELRAGCHLIVENTQVCHRRVGFLAGPPATSRWLRRCYGCSDIGLSLVADPKTAPYLWGWTETPGGTSPRPATTAARPHPPFPMTAKRRDDRRLKRGPSDDECGD